MKGMVTTNDWIVLDVVDKQLLVISDYESPPFGSTPMNYFLISMIWQPKGVYLCKCIASVILWTWTNSIMRLTC